MRSLDNIEPSAFKGGRYIGYSDGVWVIERVGRVWKAWRSGDPVAGTLYAPTLIAMSDQLHARKG